jgi:hypothetical protein
MNWKHKTIKVNLAAVQLANCLSGILKEVKE